MLSEKMCRDRMNGNLSHYRYKHSENVAVSAKKLARIYGADEEKAYITGLIHDITKEFSEEEHKCIFKNYNIKLDFIQENTPKLWHSISGAAYIRYVMGENDEDIYNAIKYHTTARENMSLLEKIIYVSDFVSAERDYKGVDRIRGILEKDGLEACVLEGLSFSIKDLAEDNNYIHTDTVSAYNQVLSNFKNRKGV